MDLPAVDAATIRDNVVEALRNAIWKGHLRPGQHLVEAQLAARLRVSRSTVREALGVLAAEGLVSVKPRRGCFVTRLTPKDVEEIYTMRMALEELALSRALKRFTPQQLAELRRLVEKLHSPAADDPVVRSETTSRFHEIIFEAADHERLLEARKRLASVQRLLGTIVQMTLPEEGPRHELLLASIEKGDQEGALTALREHINFAWQLVTRALTSPSPEAGRAGSA